MPVRETFLPFGRPCIGEEEIAEVVDTLRSGWIGTGPRCQQFEREFSDYIGCRQAVAVSSCTAGLHLSLVISGIGPGDEVITTPMTFAATGNVIFQVGARPVFVDIDRRTLNIDSLQIEKAITARTRAIVPVHFGGLPCDMERIGAIAQRHGLAVIEDAAHAFGSRYHGRTIGALGNLTSFSFYPNKNITTAEGGMITTESEAVAEELRVWRLHGMSSDAWRRFGARDVIRSEVTCPGFKYNLTDLQAALGIWQLRKAERFLEVRERYAGLYDEAFMEMDEVALQPRPQNVDCGRHALHLYVLLLDVASLRAGRDEFVAALREENVGTGIHYKALHLHQYYQERLGHVAGDFPNAEYVSERTLSLPLSPAMTERDVKDVIQAVKQTVWQFKATRPLVIRQ